jgi:hypothetical protein
MTEEDAAKWAANNGTKVQKVAGTPERRMVGDPYIGWGGFGPPASKPLKE